ncbi:hypothetical protein AGMMS49545_09930 [Betaproteobacteria bacterium]|nr:hypothetical protein AGMMS49545_09930 [Betaproteobacteria bacterium]GHU42580.1 hypothetical protein AGMMS50289_07520 [Betaproteobacteria bacterium]
MTSLAEKRYFSHPGWSRLGDIALVLCVLLAGTVVPRFMLSGGWPGDDGYYAFWAQWIHHNLVNGQGLPDAGGLLLYPILVSWVFYFDYNPFVALRFIDLGMATLAAFFLYRIVNLESGSKAGAALIVLVFTFTMNQYTFVTFGFKNSITIAFIPLFLAIHIGQNIVHNKQTETGVNWLAAGALTALAVVLRETFVPFAVLGLVSVFIMRGRKAAFHFFLGGVIAGVLLIGGILIARGSVSGAIEGYRVAGYTLISAPGTQIMDNFFDYGLLAIQSSSKALMISALAGFILMAIAVTRQNKRILSGLLFWLCFAGIALIEPATKICFEYHFAVALPGLAGLCALAFREIARECAHFSWANHKTRDAILLMGVFLFALWYSSVLLSGTRHMLPITLETLTLAPNNEWPEVIHQAGSFLSVGDEIKKLIPEDGTLSVNRNAELFFPFTGRLPPSSQLANLSALGFKTGFSVPRIKEALLACAPDAILMNSYEDWLNGYGSNQQLLTAILETGIYDVALEMRFEKEGSSSDDDITVTLFKKTKETTCLES